MDGKKVARAMRELMQSVCESRVGFGSPMKVDVAEAALADVLNGVDLPEPVIIEGKRNGGHCAFDCPFFEIQTGGTEYSEEPAVARCRSHGVLTREKYLDSYLVANGCTACHVAG